MHNNFLTKRIIIGSSLILLILLVVISGNSLYTLTHIGNELGVITKQAVPLSKNINRSKRYLQKMSLHVERAISYSSISHLSGTYDGQFNTEIDAFIKLSQKFDAEILTGEKLSEEDRSSYTTELNELRLVNHTFLKIRKKFSVYKFNTFQVFNLLKEERIQEAEAIDMKLEFQKEQLIFELNFLSTEIDKLAERANIKAKMKESIFNNKIKIFSILRFIIAGYLSGLFYRDVVSSRSKGTTK